MRLVESKIRKTDGKERSGRGFSREELKKAGLSKTDAKKLRIPVDARRKTTYTENLEALSAYVKNRKAEILKPKKSPQSKKKAKK